MSLYQIFSLGHGEVRLVQLEGGFPSSDEVHSVSVLISGEARCRSQDLEEALGLARLMRSAVPTSKKKKRVKSEKISSEFKPSSMVGEALKRLNCYSLWC